MTRDRADEGSSALIKARKAGWWNWVSSLDWFWPNNTGHSTSCLWRNRSRAESDKWQSWCRAFCLGCDNVKQVLSVGFGSGQKYEVAWKVGHIPIPIGSGLSWPKLPSWTSKSNGDAEHQENAPDNKNTENKSACQWHSYARNYGQQGKLGDSRKPFLSRPESWIRICSLIWRGKRTLRTLRIDHAITEQKPYQMPCSPRCYWI